MDHAGIAARGRRDVVVALRRAPKHVAMLPQIVEMANGGSGIDLISRALGIGLRPCGTRFTFTKQGGGHPAGSMAVAATVGNQASRSGRSVGKSKRTSLVAGRWGRVSRA